MKHLVLTTIAAVLLVGCGSSINDAAGSGDIEAVKRHLANGVDVNAKSDWNSSVLHDAAMNGQAEVVELLIPAGADVNAKNNSGYTPLHEASNAAFFNNAEKVMKLLISAGADVNAKDNEGLIPLHYAATKNAAAMLIASGSGVNTKGQNGLTPLHARAQNSVEIVELLIEKDADVNALDYNGNTPLDITRDPDLTYNSVERERIANLFRKHGGKTSAELNGLSGSIASPKKTASKQESYRLAANKDLLYDTKFGTIEDVKKHLANGADVNAKGDFIDGVPLCNAAKYGKRDIVDLLISKGANLEAMNIDRTPLHFAVIEGHKEIVELLISKGADLSAKDPGLNSPLDLAITLKNKEIADLLRKYGGKTKYYEELKAEGK